MSRFRVGEVVALKAAPDRQGSIIQILQEVSGTAKYRVFHGQSDIREYFEDQLALIDELPDETDPIRYLLSGEWTSPERFIARITASRLSNPQSDSIYSLHAARVQYIPFQFKPLLRFLRAEQPRILIADEVGVGKTIEAGLILQELQTRQDVENILIVCPKALVTKWQAEMRRFDEEFHPLSSDTLKYCLRETELDGVWPAQYSKAIVHLELLRSEDYIAGRRNIPGLLTLDPPPAFDVVVFDEAHHLRNTDTNSHEVARFLCDISEAAILLSATPVHVGSENLFALLRLLRPDLFPDFSTFQSMVEPNEHLNKAMRYLRAQLPEDNWRQEATGAIEDALNTRWGADVLRFDQRLIHWYEQLQVASDFTDDDRIACVRDLEEVHTLSHIMNRTRRRDIGRFTIREPHTVQVDFTSPQRMFYERLLEFRRHVLLLDYDPRVVRLITDTLERQASSCLPALIPTLDTFLRTGRFSSQPITDDMDLEIESLPLPRDLIDLAYDLRQMAEGLSPDDPKLEQLQQIVDEVMEISSPKKVLVFSFFLHTLYYLKNQLSKLGYRVSVISGRVIEEERQWLRERFRLPHEYPAAIDVLLSSEVGCEGLDYEFCDCLINYDIPWNPMRIEQRIGRIDRFGQTSDKVLIYNFITPGTVEERIFFRCYDRLGIFRDTVGDLEGVLGEIAQHLTQVAFDPTLTLEQAAEQAKQMADNAIRRVEEQRRLETESESFFSLDSLFLEEFDSLIDAGRFVSPDSLRQMISLFLEHPEINGKLLPDTQESEVYRLRLNQQARNMVLNRVESLKRFDRTTQEFKRWLKGNEATWIVTFDQQVALEQRALPFITPIHPLSKIAIEFWQDIPEPLVTIIHSDDDSLIRGDYLFIFETRETIGVQSEVRLVAFAWNVHKHIEDRSIAQYLLRMGNEMSYEGNTEKLSESDLQLGMEKLNEISHQARLDALDELRQRNDYQLARRLASLESYYNNRISRVENELNQATDDRIQRMKLAERTRIQFDLNRKRDEIESKRECDILSQRIAVGILRVGEKTS